MNKTENSLVILLTILISSLILFACSTQNTESNRVTSIESTTTAETTPLETTYATANIQNENHSQKDTIPTQSTELITEAYKETNAVESYEKYDDSYYEEDYDQYDYEEPEQEYEQYDIWGDNNYNYEHEHSFYIHGTIHPTAHHDGAIVYECDCGESYTEPIPCTGNEPHDESSADMELIDEYTTTVSTPDGERIRYVYVYQCTICGYIEEVFYQDD